MKRNVILILFSLTLKINSQIPDCGTITDIDGNTYNTVIINDKCWMKENLKTTRYADSTAILYISDDSIWSALGNNNYDKAYCYYNDNVNSVYGALYSWSAATDGQNSNCVPSYIQGVCPNGWHIPSDNEWIEMIDYLGGYDTAGGKLKQTGTSLWKTPNTYATNEAGYTALPGGNRVDNSGISSNAKSMGFWWSTTEKNNFIVQIHYLKYNSGKIIKYPNGFYKSHGLSVRCIKDYDIPDTLTLLYPEKSSIIGTNIIHKIQWKSNFNTNKNIKIELYRNSIYVDTITNSTENDGEFEWNIPDSLVADSTYSIKISQIYNTCCYNESSQFTIYKSCGQVIDIDSNIYNTVIIGDQCWLSENLKTTRYPNGDTLKYISNDSTWAILQDNNIDKAYCYYNNNTNSVYGAMYTWSAATNGIESDCTPSNVQGICPNGWHLPSSNEWELLIEFLGGSDTAGGKLKQTGTTLWNTPNTNATNETYFTALPGGNRLNTTGVSNNAKSFGFWWSTSERSKSLAEVYYIKYNEGKALQYENAFYKSHGISVRCIKDYSPQDLFIIVDPLDNSTSQNDNKLKNSSYSIQNRKTNQEDNILLLFPNPVGDILHITSQNKKINSIIIFDRNGKTLMMEQINNTYFSLSCLNLNQDVFFIKVLMEDNNDKVFKIIKSK